MLRTLVIDDHPLIRCGLKELLQAEWDGEILFEEAENGPQAIEKIAQSEWDVVLVDINLPGRNGMLVLEDIKAMQPDLPVLILSAHEESEFLVRVLKSGAAGFIAKDSTHHELVKAIKTVIAGGKHISSTGALLLLDQLQESNKAPAHASLTQREFQVLCMLGEGKTPAEIATALSLSFKTISTCRAHILEKMNMKTTAELIRYALEHRLTEA